MYCVAIVVGVHVLIVIVVRVHVLRCNSGTCTCFVQE